jgi:hypothetical protein
MWLGAFLALSLYKLATSVLYGLAYGERIKIGTKVILSDLILVVVFLVLAVLTYMGLIL